MTNLKSLFYLYLSRTCLITTLHEDLHAFLSVSHKYFAGDQIALSKNPTEKLNILSYYIFFVSLSRQLKFILSIYFPTLIYSNQAQLPEENRGQENQTDNKNSSLASGCFKSVLFCSCPIVLYYSMVLKHILSSLCIFTYIYMTTFPLWRRVRISPLCEFQRETVGEPADWEYITGPPCHWRS